MKAIIVYDNVNDRKLVELLEFKKPTFVEFVNFNTQQGRKDSYKIKSPFAAKKNPFIKVMDDEDNFMKCFYSEDKNAVMQFIEWINESIN